jgi:hypothetical protein
LTSVTPSSPPDKTLPDDDNELARAAAIADNIESLEQEQEENKPSLDGFGSASITSTSIDEEEDEDEGDPNAYFRDEIIAHENRKFTPKATTDIGNGNGKATTNQTIAQQQLTNQDIKFVLDTMSKEAPYDVVSIKQLFFGMASAFTKCPIHHSVNSRKTGAGKTHDLTLVSGYFPRKYVVALAGMSDKALFHRHGVNVIVDENTGNTMPVQPIIDDLKSKIQDLEEKNEKENKKEIQKLKSEIQELNDKSQKLIELDNKIFLFLDTARKDCLTP